MIASSAVGCIAIGQERNIAELLVRDWNSVPRSVHHYES